jgi:hypothetical protein
MRIRRRGSAGKRLFLMAKMVGLVTGVLMLEIIQLFEETASKAL